MSKAKDFFLQSGLCFKWNGSFNLLNLSGMIDLTQRKLKIGKHKPKPVIYVPVSGEGMRDAILGWKKAIDLMTAGNVPVITDRVMNPEEFKAMQSISDDGMYDSGGIPGNYVVAVDTRTKGRIGYVDCDARYFSLPATTTNMKLLLDHSPETHAFKQDTAFEDFMNSLDESKPPTKEELEKLEFFINNQTEKSKKKIQKEQRNVTLTNRTRKAPKSRTEKRKTKPKPSGGRN